MLSDESVDIESLPFPKAREHWLAVRQVDKKSAVELACRLIPLYSGRPFFAAQALDLVKTTEDELRVARLVLDVAEQEAGVQLQPVFGCRETMDPGRSGLVVSERTAEGSAAEVIALLSKPQRLVRMKRCALRFVRRIFSVDQMMGSLHDHSLWSAVPAGRGSKRKQSPKSPATLA